ncbi:MAG: Methionyl-tRNA synthetase, partial [Xanthobacteraceae bacterium]|nr:Methionyl-tRNA synthetase [Xanthobacteraceae bacterium]
MAKRTKTKAKKSKKTAPAKKKKVAKKAAARKPAARKTKRKVAKSGSAKSKSAKTKAAPKKAKSKAKPKAAPKAKTKSKTKAASKPKTKSKAAVTPKAKVAPAPKVETKSPTVAPQKAPLKPKAAAKPKVATKPAASFAPLGDSKPRYYITTAISYPNGPPHIGHAYEVIATDAIARFKRLDGYDVLFLTGTDEHGQKIQQTAAKEGLTAKELLDRNVPRFRAMVERMNCSNDDFIRTTEERHHRSSAAIWQKMEANGDIYLDRYAGWYSVRDERYYAEDETHTNEHKVRLATETGTPVEWVEEESYFFRLSAYQQKLLDLYERDPTYVLPKERLNEVASFVRGGLQDLSISRTTFDWGIPVPGNPKHIMYVWVDALTNYITAAGFPDADGDKFKRYWPADLHVIGKDIVRFHAVYWPAFLMSAGVAVPRRIFSHGFLFNRGEKMSKSVGNVVDPFTMSDTYGVDPLRYFFLREVPFGQDGNCSHEAIVNRINADLANDLGILAQRVLSMINKNCAAEVPQPGPYTDADRQLLDRAGALLGI